MAAYILQAGWRPWEVFTELPLKPPALDLWGL